ncbi:MAG TPA: hypothetical protein VHF23_07160 [Gaiellaceae bacterium]|nr:hypothetical protein [Gaiellaceae bacterium]
MFPISRRANQLSRTPDSGALAVWTGDAECAADLAAFLACTAYRAVRATPETLAVVPPPGLDASLARRELESYLHLWRRRHPGRGVELVPTA